METGSAFEKAARRKTRVVSGRTFPSHIVQASRWAEADSGTTGPCSPGHTPSSAQSCSRPARNAASDVPSTGISSFLIPFWLCRLQAALRATGMAGQRERGSLVIPELWEPSAPRRSRGTCVLHGLCRERGREPICSPWMSARALLQPPELGLLVCSLPWPGLLLSAR